MKSRVKAMWLAFLLGTFGAHHFYMGNKTAGVISCVFCWTAIPTIVSIINGIMYARVTDKQFNIMYVPE